MRIQILRSRSLLLLITASIVLPLAPLGAQVVPASRADSARVEQLREWVRYLAGDELAGRRTGREGNLDAAKFIAARFVEFGIMPLPKSKGFFHHFDYLAGIEVGSGNALVIEKDTNALLGKRNVNKPLLIQGRDFNPLGFSDAGSASGEMVFAGYGISARDLGYDDYAGIDVKGKIVVVMRYSPDGSNPHGELARHGALSRKVAVARDNGAAGLIIINPPLDTAVLMKTTLDRSFTNAGLPVVFALSSAFEIFRDPTGRTFAQVQEAIDRDRKPSSFLLRQSRATMTVDITLKRASVPNVIGVLPGTDPKLRDEIIVVGGHFDHLGDGGEGSLHGGHEPAIHHGADDNASGTAGVIALAEEFARRRDNRRTILFMGFNGEEEGLLGSSAMVADPPFALDKVVAMINMDMIGRLDSSTLIVQGTGTSPWWKEMLPRVNQGRFTLKMVEDGFGPSDHSSFYGKGIPVLFFFTGLHADYHRPSDTWEKVNYAGEARLLDYVADMMRAIDARDDRPPFTKTQSTTQGGGTTFKVYVGTIPDYAFDGKGLRLTGVAEGGPAQKGGLKEGDIIIRMGTKQINNIYDYTYALSEFKPKEKVEVEFLRAQEKMKTMVEMGSR